MGGTSSQEDYDSFALEYFGYAQRDTCLLPDAGIDEFLLKYSGTDSNAVLQAYSDQQVDSLPDYIGRLGSSLAPLTMVPNAVGLGALVLSMIIEISIKSNPQTNTQYSMFQRVFGVKKVSSVRNTMSEYLGHHRTFMNNKRRLKEELKRLEAQLSNHLTILKNFLLQDRQMSTHDFKIWVNGAAFHIQMLVHEARLQTGGHQSDYVESITAAVDLYLTDLDRLLAKYKTFMSSKLIIKSRPMHSGDDIVSLCEMMNSEVGCFHQITQRPDDHCRGDELNKSFMNVVFSKYEPILSIKSNFLNIKNNLVYLINQHDSFSLPS